MDLGLEVKVKVWLSLEVGGMGLEFRTEASEVSKGPHISRFPG